jgi:hypothetical protein
MTEDAAERAAELNLECEPSVVYEVRLKRGRVRSIAGYEVYLECADAPAAGVGLYYDIELEFLAALAYGS